MNSKAIRKQLLAAVAMVLVAAVALGSSTYAWFVTNNSVTATAFKGTATTANNLLISLTNNKDYATTVKMGITMDKFTPVSAGVDYIKAGTLYKVREWSDEKDTSNDNSNKFNSTGKLANVFELAKSNKDQGNIHDYAVQDIYLLSTTAQTIYFDNQTVITASKQISIPATGEGATGMVNYTVTATYNAGTIATKVVDGSQQTVLDTAYTPVMERAVADVEAALGALRITVAKAGENDSTVTETPVFFTLQAEAESSAGYWNTATAADAAVDITAAQVISEVDSSTARPKTLVTDPAVLLSTYSTSTTNSTESAGTNALCTLEADVPQHFIVYIYLEGCDKQCVTGISDNVTFGVDFGFSGFDPVAGTTT